MEGQLPSQILHQQNTPVASKCDNINFITQTEDRQIEVEMTGHSWQIVPNPLFYEEPPILSTPVSQILVNPPFPSRSNPDGFFVALFL